MKRLEILWEVDVGRGQGPGFGTPALLQDVFQKFAFIFGKRAWDLTENGAGDGQAQAFLNASSLYSSET